MEESMRPAKPVGKTCPHCGITWAVPEGHPANILKYCTHCAGWLGGIEKEGEADTLTEAVRRGNIHYYVEHQFPETRVVAKLPEGHPES